jgi:hypothetical protein
VLEQRGVLVDVLRDVLPELWISVELVYFHGELAPHVLRVRRQRVEYVVGEVPVRRLPDAVQVDSGA